MFRYISKWLPTRHGNGSEATSRFNKNAGILTAGSVTAQFIPLAVSPILTRLFSPADFGVLMLFVSIYTIVGTVATLRYEMAIQLPESESESNCVALVAITMTFVISLICLLLVLLAGDWIAAGFGGENFKKWLLLVPLAVFLTGLFNTLNYLALRGSQYPSVAAAGISRSVVTSASQVTMGAVGLTPGGLIVGQLLGAVTACGLLARKGIATGWIGGKTDFQRLWSAARRYKDFPLYSVWAALANTASTHATNILVSVYFSVASLGLYSLVARVVGSPTAFIGQSIGQVFFQESGMARRSGAEVLPLFMSTFYKLALLSVGPFAILFFISEGLFAFVFGEQWRSAGELARVMIPAFAIRFIISPLSSVNAIHEENKIGLYANLVLLLLSAGSIIFAGIYGLDFKLGLIILSVSLSGFYFIYFFVLRERTRVHDMRMHIEGADGD